MSETKVTDNLPSIKENYFNDRIKQEELVGDRERENLGRRELITLVKFARDFFGRDLVSTPARKLVCVDAGCGDRFLQKPFEDAHIDYVGFDVADMDFERDKFDLPDESVDIFLSLAVIEHLADPSVFFSEAYRVLKPGGFIYVSAPNFAYDYRHFYDDPTHVKPYTPMGLEAMLRMYDFKNIQTFPGVRCKPKWYSSGRWRFFKAYYLLPFRGNAKFAPSFLRGHARSVFGMAVK